MYKSVDRVALGRVGTVASLGYSEWGNDLERLTGACRGLE